MRELWPEIAPKFSVLAKYDVALSLNGCETFDKGSSVYQPADDLIQLRKPWFTIKSAGANTRSQNRCRLRSG
jgi:hypothetical protein